jgi:hypothetical protein
VHARLMPTVSQLALRDDRRRCLAFADLCTASHAEKCENNCRTERELFHFFPHVVTLKNKDRRGIQGPLVQKRHTSQMNRCLRTSARIPPSRNFLYGVEMTAFG